MTILLDPDGLCDCSCADKCLFGKTGSSFRCTKQEFENAGFKTKVPKPKKKKKK